MGVKQASGISSLLEHVPELDRLELISQLWLPPEFQNATLATYRPDPLHPSQASAHAHIQNVVAALTSRKRPRLRRPKLHHTYLDGGFGVGKTHLLASAAHSLGSTRARFGSFVEYTQIVGALGFQPTLSELAQYPLICIDEFELDDPGDTLIMARLLRELASRGTTVLATSNTLPGQLGAGRFAAEDFQREIQGLATQFAVVTIDGPDFRHRDSFIPGQAWPNSLQVHREGIIVTDDDFGELLKHIATIHQSKYRALIEPMAAAVWRNAYTIDDERIGLRLVALVDRLYDERVPVLITGSSVHNLFTTELINGAYRKKYLRATSRLGALGAQAQELFSLQPPT